MTTLISGIATRPARYESVAGLTIDLRPDDIRSAIQNSTEIPIVLDHDDRSFGNRKGYITKLEMVDDGKLYYEAVLNDSSTEETVIRMYQQEGQIPNVSPMLVPNTDELKMTYDDSGDIVYHADEWYLEHLSLVHEGRCSDEDGCGVFNVLSMSGQGTPQEIQPFTVTLSDTDDDGNGKSKSFNCPYRHDTTTTTGTTGDTTMAETEDTPQPTPTLSGTESTGVEQDGLKMSNDKDNGNELTKDDFLKLWSEKDRLEKEKLELSNEYDRVLKENKQLKDKLELYEKDEAEEMRKEILELSNGKVTREQLDNISDMNALKLMKESWGASDEPQRSTVEGQGNSGKSQAQLTLEKAREERMRKSGLIV